MRGSIPRSVAEIPHSPSGHDPPLLAASTAKVANRQHGLDFGQPNHAETGEVGARHRIGIVPQPVFPPAAGELQCDSIRLAKRQPPDIRRAAYA